MPLECLLEKHGLHLSQNDFELFLVSKKIHHFGEVLFLSRTYKTDTVSATIALGKVKGKEEMTCIVFVCYIAHRLELAIQDALKDTFFDEVDSMILRTFYLYQKSLKTPGN